MGRFDADDEDYANKLRVLTRVLPFEVREGAQYREHWVMKRSHRGRRTNWTAWHRDRPSKRNIDIFVRRYTAFEIIEEPPFTLDEDEGIRVVMQWCNHMNAHAQITEPVLICPACEQMLRHSRRQHKINKRGT